MMRDEYSRGRPARKESQLESRSHSFGPASCTLHLHHLRLEPGHLINWFISKIGRQIDSTMKPTAQPITRIMVGSR